MKFKLANQEYFLLKFMNNYNFENLLPNEIQTLIDDLNALLLKSEKDNNTIYKMANKEKNIICCPKCHGRSVKNGHTKNGVQTYKCKECNSRFNDLTNTIFHHTHLVYGQVKKFLECMRDKFSIRKTAQIVGISTKAVFALRHKILDTFKDIRNNIKLKGEIEADEYYLSINLKGSLSYNMPRASKPRKTKGTGARGINSHKVCIETAIDEFDNLFLEIAGTGPITSKMIKETLISKVGNIKKLITDCKSSYESVAKENGWNLIQIKSGTYTNESGYNLANINSIHSGLDRFLSHFHGVSTNHLQHYLDWFMNDKYLNYTVNILEQVHVLETTIISKNTSISYKNMYENQSKLDYISIYADYNYHANCST